MKKYNLKEFKLLNSEKISLYYNKNIFEPNLTTSLLIDSIKKITKKKNKVLDLGCGCGVVSFYLYKKKIINKIYSSDISQDAIKCSIYNAKYFNANYDIRYSDMLDNWKNCKFDVIINDISGISTKISSITKWFKFAPNDSGADGINFTIKVLENYKKYLNKNGSLIFPIIGLSNRQKIIKFMNKKSIKYKILKSQTWPLPKDLHKHIKFLKSLKKKNIINFDEKFNFLTTKTEILVCK